MASELLGSVWERRELIEPDEGDELGLAMVAEISIIGGAGAAVLLAGFAMMSSDAHVAKAATAALAKLKEQADWLADIGRAELVAVAMMSESVFDDGRTYFIEARRPDGSIDAVGVYVDNNIGRSAKDILLAPSIEDVRATLAEVPADAVAEVSIEPVDPAVAGRRLRAALDLTDRTLNPIVEKHYASLRAVALNRVGLLPGEDLDPDFDAADPDERDALMEEFLGSDEGAGIELGNDAADVVAAAIDYASDHSDGSPLRWSPVVVELFMADWLPRKVVADDAYFAAVPEALAAWIRFAAGKRDLPKQALKVNLEAIEVHREEMLDALANPRGGSPTDELFAALRGAEIDVSDEQALQTFIAGWNARSTLD